MGETKVVRVNIADKLSAADWEVIDAFKRRAKKLRATRMSRDASVSRISVSITLDAGGFRSDVKLPPDEVISHQLVALRHFFLKKEPAFMLRVLNALAKHMTEDERQAISWFRERWHAPPFDGAIWLRVGANDVSAEGVIDLWCNGEYFHSDKEKVEGLELLNQVITPGFSKYMLVDVMHNWTKLILRLDDGLESLRRPEPS